MNAVISARSSLLDGREASAVEKEIELKLKSAEQSCEDAARVYIVCDKALSVSKERLADSEKVYATAAGELTSANEQMDKWIELFFERKGTPITLEEIDLRRIDPKPSCHALCKDAHGFSPPPRGCLVNLREDHPTRNK